MYKPSTDEFYRVVMIDRHRKVKMSIQLRTETGDEVPIKDAIQKLSEYVMDKVKQEDENSCKQQILPLMAQSMVGGLQRILGPTFTGMILAQDHTRYGIIHMMAVSFYLLKWIQKKNLKIFTIEEPLTQDDIDTYERVSRASSGAIMGQLAGYDGKEILKEMLKTGQIKQEDLAKMGMEKDTPEDSN